MTDPKAEKEEKAAAAGSAAVAKAKKPTRARRAATKKAPVTTATEEAPKPKSKPPKETPPPRRPKLSPELARLLAFRRGQDAHRPLFVRTASHRYWRIGRWGSWRRPKGLQSKQRRHYGYRPTVVSIGFRSPRLVRGRTSTGFRPILVQTPTEVNRIDPAHEAAVIARTVGTRQRLVLEEAARKRGVHVLNPLTKDTRET
ncbi:MAG: 50S ribosomal protein L32e [Thermoplasmata archaeon]|nr:50S ribosomal protein L32e [Thermoplasmata archaeon]